jgi:hypothetical protein
MRASEYEDAAAILQHGLDQNWTSNQYLQAFSDKPDSGPVYTVRTALAVNQQTAHKPQVSYNAILVAVFQTKFGPTSEGETILSPATPSMRRPVCFKSVFPFPSCGYLAF